MAKKKKAKKQESRVATAKPLPDWRDGTIHFSSATHGPADDMGVSIRIRLVDEHGEVLDIDMGREEFADAMFGLRSACKMRKDNPPVSMDALVAEVNAMTDEEREELEKQPLVKVDIRGQVRQRT